VTLTHRPSLTPGNFLVLIFLEAESTPGHMVPSVASVKIASDTTGDRSRDPPSSSAVPLALLYPNTKSVAMLLNKSYLNKTKLI
jgi:hypothetical protein